VQDWALTQVKFAKRSGGSTVYDPEAVKPVLVTDALHRARSVVAEEESRKAAAAVPLPPMAADGGDVRSDPSSPEQRRLSASAFPYSARTPQSVFCQV